MYQVTTWDLRNTCRDLTDIVSTLIQDQPMFLRLFPLKPPAVSVKHEWLEDVLKPRTALYTAFDPAEGRFTVRDAAGWSPGDILRIGGQCALFRVEGVSSASVTVSLLETAGSSIASFADIASEGTLIYDHHPVRQGSDSGENLFSQSQIEFNYTEIIRGDVDLTNTAKAVKTFGSENMMPYQLKRALLTVTRQANNIALFGRRSPSFPEKRVPGRAGGLYFYGTQPGSLVVEAGGEPLSLQSLNDAAQMILDSGGNPDLILCGPGQARAISRLMAEQIRFSPGQTRRGTFVASVISETTGREMEVFTEPALSGVDTDVWVLDSSSLAMLYLRDRQIHTEPASQPGYDGEKLSILGEFTFEFKNAKQKLCRIRNLRASKSGTH